MNLFINAIAKNGIIFLFDSARNITHQKAISLLGNESSKLLGIIDSFLKESSLTYTHIENLVIVNGPGSFTGVRSIVLTVNTINYIIEGNITPVSFFDLYCDYPIVKNSSRRDLFVKYEKNATICIEDNDDFLKKLGNNKCYGDPGSNLSSSDSITVSGEVDYESFIKKLTLESNTKINPLYIKKPNIS